MERHEQRENVAGAIRRNIEAIARMEEGYNQQRSLADRFADVIGDFSGSMAFVLIHVFAYGVWILANLGILPLLPRFDPFPFMLLSVLVGIEAIFLATFVLMKQNRMSRRAEERAHLDLQVNLLAETEMTQVLQILHRIAERLDIPCDPSQIEELLEETSVEAVAAELQKAIDPASPGASPTS